jgi:hypothetical protein
MPRDAEIGAGEAEARVPQGHFADASPAANPSGAEAIGFMPQGQNGIASAPGTNVEGEAVAALPQGHPADASALDDLCGNLMRLQRDRIFAIRAQSRGDRSVEAYIRVRLGFTTDPNRMNDAERKRLSALAVRIKKAVERGEGQGVSADEATMSAARACSAAILNNALARQPWDAMRDAVEKEMRLLARQTPGWAFVQTVAGVSDLGLAVIVGEAGNLGTYPTKDHLWKRLGLAVMDGRRQGNPGAGATAEDWIRHGYRGARRAEVYAFIDDVMFRSQWRGEREGVPAHPIGPYGEYYRRKKFEYAVRYRDEAGGKAHAENAARRYMAKMFVRDLWAAWRRGQFGRAERPGDACPSVARMVA